MKMNLNLTVTDEQRSALACLLAGKDVKRLASRDDVASYVLGMMAGLLPRDPAEALLRSPDGIPWPEAPVRSPKSREIEAATTKRTLTQEEARKHDELIAAGHPEGYARGWIVASRAWFGGRVG